MAAFVLAHAQGEPAVEETILAVPVKVRDLFRKEIAQDITVTVFEIPGRASYPLLVLNHGRPANDAGRGKMGRVRFAQAASYFASLGFSVWVPTRVGYGVSGTEEDPEYTGPCQKRDFRSGFDVSSAQVLQVIEHAKRRADIDRTRVVVAGQSFGGATSIAVAARNPDGVVASINFAGGSGGNPETRPGEPCLPRWLEALFGEYGKTSRIPTLWVYTENDRYFGPHHTKTWFEAFKAGGGAGEFVLLPAFGNDGHALFTRGFEIWRPIVGRFLDTVKAHAAAPIPPAPAIR